MLNIFVIDTLVRLFKDEIENVIEYDNNEIIVKLDNGLKVKILAKNVA